MRHLVGPLLAVPLLVLVPTSAAEAAGTCQGLPATVESTTPGAALAGTEGPDVILATNTATITALGGDDVICAAGGRLDAGAGNDSVVVTTTGNTNLQSADLGPGVNHYTSTGPMIDVVTSGTPTEPNLDVVNTGDSSDQLTVQLPPGSHLQATGGSGAVPTAQFVVRNLADDAGSWDLQLPSTLTRNDAVVATLANFGSASLVLGASASVRVRGTSGTDNIGVSAGRVDVDLGAGLDVLSLGGSSGPLPASGRIALGAGRDQLFATSSRRLALDLGHGRLGKVKVSGIEQSQLRAPRIRYVGSRRADIGTAYGCKVTMNGGKGNDLLAPIDRDNRPDLDCVPRFRLFGQAGNDELYGGPGKDLLVGGPGRDKANGDKGTDLCSAEKEFSCERR